MGLLPRVSLQRLLDWVKRATWSFSSHIVGRGLSPTRSPAIYIPGPRELLLTQHNLIKCLLGLLGAQARPSRPSPLGQALFSRSGIPSLLHFFFPLPDLPLPLNRKIHVWAQCGHGRVPKVAWLFGPFKGMPPMLSPLRGLKSHTSLKLFVLSGLTSSPTLVEIPLGQPHLGWRGGAEAVSLGRRGGGKGLLGACLLTQICLLPPQSLRKAQSHWGPRDTAGRAQCELGQRVHL